jgi:hypothetical protein
VVGSYEHGNEPSGFIKGGKFHDQLIDCQLHKEDPAAWKWLLYLTEVWMNGLGVETHKRILVETIHVDIEVCIIFMSPVISVTSVRS